MNEYPFVSVIIPAKNEAKCINKCLDSLVNINYPKNKYEIIVVDNNSTDKTFEIVNSYKNIKILSMSTGTIGALRNYGAKNSKGEIIAFLDADCVPDANWLRIGCNYLISDQNISCVGFNMSEPSFNSTWVEKTWYKMSSVSKYKGVCEVKWLSSFNLIVNKVDFKKVGGFDESLETCEDADFGHKLHSYSKLIFSNEITVTHLGNAKTLWELFLKELWRGKNNLNSFLKTNYKINTLPSILVPFGYTILVFMFIVLLFFNGLDNKTLTLTLTTLFLIVLVPIILAMRKRFANSVEFIQIMILYYIYLIARGLAVFGIRIKSNP